MKGGGVSVSEEELANMSFADFRRSCEKVVVMSDQELTRLFSRIPNATPQEIRQRYNHILATMTEEDYRKLQSTKNVNIRKAQGNALLAERRYVEARQKYVEALTYLHEISDPILADESEALLRLNIAFIHQQEKEFDKVVEECQKVPQQSQGLGPAQGSLQLQRRLSNRGRPFGTWEQGQGR